jgi:biotin carboxyl carrier protein
LKFRVEVDGETRELQLQPQGNDSDYSYILEGTEGTSGPASVIEIRPGVFSVLLGLRSFTVYLSKDRERVEASVENARHWVLVSDARDRRAGTKTNAASGPMEVRSQMPGKIIKVLVTPGSAVTAGQGLLVVEAMKMQNEMKSPKDGVVARIQGYEGATVVAGETLVVIE